MKCRMVHLIENQDMRTKHDLLQGKKARSLKRGQCLVALNSAQTIARVVDYVGGLHEYHAVEGERFSLARITDLMRQGIGLELAVGVHEVHKEAAA